MAYAQTLPMLIIHHKGVIRGIFDRGAIPNYIYEFNLEEPDWSLKKEIQGAIRTWKADVLSRQKKLSTIQDNLKNNETNPIKGLTTECKTILTIVARFDKKFSVQDISSQIDFSLQKIQYCVDRLMENKFLDRYRSVAKSDLYLLSSKGREYLFSNNLIN